MKLDSRVIECKKPLDCYDTQEAKDYIGKYCYFSNQLEDFSDLDIFTDVCAIEHDRHIGILKKVSDSLFRPFKMRDVDDYYGVCDFTYILPMEWLNKEKSEKKCRPFTSTEFIEKFEFTLGMVIRFRDIHTRYEYKTVFSGYRWCDDVFEVFLNGSWIDMPTLLDTYECYEDNEWKKFGVEE